LDDGRTDEGHTSRISEIVRAVLSTAGSRETTESRAMTELPSGVGFVITSRAKELEP